ncbi:MAG: polyphenol oxidase family protein [Coriobacteriia bacterium]|jgi:YfiH family protein|nr:polyphenol oxidase family protein [Coriobacteriia bacterium]
MMAEHPNNHDRPHLVRHDTGSGVCVWTDSKLAQSGVLVAFSERLGGMSAAPCDSLNLAAHVGDDPGAVDVNRDKLLNALGIGGLRRRLVTAQQVHGDRVCEVCEADAGAGAYASGTPPLAGVDALMTRLPDTPLLLMYADCVPVVLVAPPPATAVCVVHAGWRGALKGLPGRSARALALMSGCAPASLHAYIGAHIGQCCYQVGEDILSQFRTTFDTIGAVVGGLDLAAAVRESLVRAGLAEEGIVELGVCTRDHTDRFFSYRASAITGRHGALAVITKGEYDESASSAEQRQST